MGRKLDFLLDISRPGFDSWRRFLSDHHCLAMCVSVADLKVVRLAFKHRNHLMKKRNWQIVVVYSI